MPYLILAAGLGVCLFVGWVVLPLLDQRRTGPRRQADRRVALTIHAATAGLIAAPTPGDGWPRVPDTIRPSILFAGRYQGRRIAIAEYRQLPPKRRWRRGRIRRRTVISVDLHTPQPPVQVIRRGLDPRVWDPTTGQQVATHTVLTGSGRFDRVFRVSTPLPDQVDALTDPRLSRSMLRDRSTRAWLVSGTVLLGVSDGWLEPHCLLPRVSAVRMVADLLEHAGQRA